MLETNTFPEDPVGQRRNKKYISEKEILKTIPLTLSSKTIFRTSLTRKEKNLYSEIYMTLMKNIEDTNGKIFHLHGSK